jgi:phage-related holin
MLEKIKLIIYAVSAYLGVGVEAFAILMIFMCIDSVVGAIKSVVLGMKFSFRKMIWGFSLKLCFLIIPLVIALLGKSLGYDFHSAVNITISILTVAEVYSILGNIYAAKNKKEVDKIDAISLLLEALRKVIKKMLDSLIGSIDKKI